MNDKRVIRLGPADSFNVEYEDGTEVSIGAESAGQTSDGFHTFDELYRHRMLLNAMLLSTLAASNEPHGITDIQKSWNHASDEDVMFPGMFKVGATLPTGQVSYHYPASAWDLFRVPEVEHFEHWDGHESDEAADRMEQFLRLSPGSEWEHVTEPGLFKVLRVKPGGDVVWTEKDADSVDWIAPIQEFVMVFRPVVR